MLDKRTVLVLGAGASKPYGLPLGFELRDAVLGESTSVAFRTREGSSSGSRQEFQAFCRDLAESGSSSVDAYLEQRPTWTEIGKSAMALCLLSSECKAKDRLFPPNQPKDHWYEVLWSCLRAPSWHAFKAQPVSIVTFNYDRSLEHSWGANTRSCRALVLVNESTEKISPLDVRNAVGLWDRRSTFGSQEL